MSHTINSMLSTSRSPSAVADTEEKVACLHDLFHSTSETILRFQSPTTGLFPIRTDVECAVGDVRVSIYCAQSIWSLHLAYKRLHCDDFGRTHLLGQTAVKTMRGILTCWMYQIPKMKQFLASQTPENALHVRFDIVTGHVLAADDDYPHLQLDTVSLFLLSLVQMIASGLQIIYTCDEVDFVQNLVYCIERAYRIADYGMWQRGSKYNNGTPELNASTVGMAKAAMEAVNGFNLFGEHGAAWTVLYADVDAHMRNKTVFEELIPRESSSKMTDAALLPVLSWPSFAVHDTNVKDSTINTLTGSLKGHHGFKRFHRDGYGTVLEDKNKRYYESSDLSLLEGLECEWPFLSFFLIIDCIFKGDFETAYSRYREVQPLLKSANHGCVVPQYYYVPRAEIKRNNSNTAYCRVATNEGETNKYFLWGQSVYVVMRLLVDSLLPVNDLDPIKRHLSASERPRFSHRYTVFEASAKDRLIQVAVIAESVKLQQVLATHGIMSQTPTQVEPLQIWSPNQLMKALTFMGVNYKLGLNGRPSRPVGLLGTSMFYRICGQTVIAYPLLFEVNDFYISQDLNCVINQVQANIESLASLWKLSGRPTYIVMISEAMIQAPNAKHLIEFLSTFKSGKTGWGVRVKQDRLQSLVSSGTKEHLDFLTHMSEERAGHADLSFESIKETFSSLTFEIKLNMSTKSANSRSKSMKEIGSYPDWKLIELYRSAEELHVQSQCLKYLTQRYGTQHLVDNVPICDILEKMRRKASHSSSPDWSVVRLCSALTRKVTDSLAPSITSMLVRGKLVTLGVFGHEEQMISKPINPTVLHGMLYQLCQPIEPMESVLQQEMILILGHLNASRPELFNGILKIRIGWIVHAMQYALNHDTAVQQSIFSLSPSEISALLVKILKGSGENYQHKTALWNRMIQGCLGCVPVHFCEKIWYILERSAMGIQLYDYHLPQQPTLSDLTLQEMHFALLVEEMLSVVREPLQRHVIVEVLTVVAVVLERNPEVNFPEAVNTKDIVQRAIDLFKSSTTSSFSDDNEVMEAFYMTPNNSTRGTYSFIAKAVCTILLDTKLETNQLSDDCGIM